MDTREPVHKPISILQRKLMEHLAAAKARTAETSKPTLMTEGLASKINSIIQQPTPSTPTTISTNLSATIQQHTSSIRTEGTDRFGNIITYNPQQQAAIELAASGKSCVIIGAAGTGKTTIQKASIQALIDSGSIGTLNAKHRYLEASNPGIAIVAYTRRATNNIRKNMPEALSDCCITIHKLLEYRPVEVMIPQDDGSLKRSVRFEPLRDSSNPLPASLKVIVIEEASMVSLELFNLLNKACPHKPQFIFLGDIQQLPPVFGSAILGYKMLELPVVELTHVHRQALGSPILSLAHRILSGKPIPAAEYSKLCVPHKLKIHAWKKRVGSDSATVTLAKFFIQKLDDANYDPETDAILIPFNKSCGTTELNKHIAGRIAKRDQKFVHEIIHGWQKSYYSVGDKCLYDREDAIIQDIFPNPQYRGIPPREASLTLNYFGYDSAAAKAARADGGSDIDALLASMAVPAGKDDEDKAVRAASHVIRLYLMDSDRTVNISSAGDIDKLILGYALTIHKAQGSEWDKVYLCLHQSHATMIQRELLYTAVTRAKEELFIICEQDTFTKGIINQRIKGSTWQEKAEYFKGKLENGIEQS